MVFERSPKAEQEEQFNKALYPIMYGEACDYKRNQRRDLEVSKVELRFYAALRERSMVRIWEMRTGISLTVTPAVRRRLNPTADTAMTPVMVETCQLLSCTQAVAPRLQPKLLERTTSGHLVVGDEQWVWARNLT